jgi:hypothetical protein
MLLMVHVGTACHELRVQDHAVLAVLIAQVHYRLLLL